MSKNKRWSEKSPLTFYQWIEKAQKSGRGYLTVSPRVKQLPCGCVRDSNIDPLFRIEKMMDGWVHINGKCLDIPFNAIEVIQEQE